MAHVVALPLDLLVESTARLVSGECELLRGLFEIVQGLELGVKSGGGGDEALHLADSAVNVFGKEAEAGGVETGTEEVGVDVLEARERGVGAAAAETGGDGCDAVERVELLGESEGQEVVLVGGDKGADGVGSESVGAETRDLGVGEGAVEKHGARHGARHLEGEDADGKVLLGRRQRRRARAPPPHPVHQTLRNHQRLDFSLGLVKIRSERLKLC